MREPVRRPGLYRQQATRHLVLTLCAALEAPVAVDDAPDQRLVIAGLEVQAVDVFNGAPVATERHFVHRVDADQRGGDAPAVLPGDEHQPVLRHRAGHALEEIAREVRRRVVRAVGQRVAAVEEIPFLRRDLVALVHRERDARIGDAAPFLLDLLALLALQAGQEGDEVGVGHRLGVGPVELHRAAHHPACVGGGLLVLRVEEQQMRRRQLGVTRQLLHGLQQQRASGGVACQQSRPGHRRERHRIKQLRVVAQAVALVGVGPGPVEHVLAVRMVLQVQRTGRQQCLALHHRQELRLPAGRCIGAARSMQCQQVFVPHERRARRLQFEQFVPLCRGDAGRVVVDPDDIILIHVCAGFFTGRFPC